MERKTKIAEIINNIHPISINSTKELVDIVYFESVSKDTVFIKKDGRNDNEYFILSGIWVVYHMELFVKFEN